ncbi:MAG: DUF4912 domain-containing protein, partial [Spirochaetota bacterium]
MDAENLASLADDDIWAIADRMGLGLPPGLERIFVIEEILDAIEDDRIERDRAGKLPLYNEDAKYSSAGEFSIESLAGTSSVSIADMRYNETTIKALVRDPSWTFAFWELSELDFDSLGIEDDEPRLFLRVTQLEGPDRQSSFDIPISHLDSQWYINIPNPGTRYRIDLGARTGSKSKVLARSVDFFVPRQHRESLSTEGKGQTLLELSDMLDTEPEPLD